ncbi:MAG: hypothetical protein DDT23_00010 [candidate division WS2 bacterium]|nr:hypothetical protein [Candidatus Lithacetigena glycinireducens]
MKMNIEVKLNLKTEAAKKLVEEATRLALRDTVVAVHEDAMRGSPKKTGHNMRSIASEVSGMGMVATGGEATPEKVVDDNKLEAACFSTSGYGGFLETGTYKMNARPYFKPALDKNFTEEKFAERVKRHLERR